MVAVLFSVPVTRIGTSAATHQEMRGLRLEIQTDKDHYLPGELITVQLKITNASDGPLALPRNADVFSGGMNIFVAETTGNFRSYKGPRWGLRDGVGGRTKTLAPGESVSESVTVLYNHVTSTSHLSELYATPVKNDSLDTEYAFPHAGAFRLKAVLSDDRFSTSIESAPVDIIIDEPGGPDLVIWNKIKDDGGYGYFFQTGEVLGRSHAPTIEEIELALKELESLYPTSRYAKNIRASLASIRKPR
jgi:hypothetical protein